MLVIPGLRRVRLEDLEILPQKTENKKLLYPRPWASVRNRKSGNIISFSGATMEGAYFSLPCKYCGVQWQHRL